MMSGFPTLWVMDLDGTVLGGGYEPYARIPDPFARFLGELADRGCQWATNTTWGIPDQWAMIQRSEVIPPRFLMGEVGYRLAEIRDGEPALVEPYTKRMFNALVEAQRKHLFPLMADLCGRFDKHRLNFYGHWFEMCPFEEDREAFFSHVRATYAEGNGLYLEVADEGRRLIAFPRVLGKGAVLRAAIELLGLTPENVVVAGDGVQDLDMMCPDLTAHVVCPGNSHQEVQRRVRELDGEVGQDVCGRGTMQAFTALARRRRWRWPAAS